MASFEQNQQDQFNMDNRLDRLNQWQANMDRTVSSIGDAELAAEEELLEAKQRNLSAVQKASLKLLDQLSDREEESIRELANLRQKLSDKQFLARKKDIERELKLAEEAADALAKAENVKKGTKKSTAKKRKHSPVEDIVSSVVTKPTAKAQKTAKSNTQSALLELNETLHAIDNTLTGLQDSVKSIRIQLGKELQTLNTPSLTAQQTTQGFSSVETAVDALQQIQPEQSSQENQGFAEPVTVDVEQTAPILEPIITVEPTPVTVENVTTVQPTPVTVESPTVAIEQTPIVTQEPADTASDDSIIAAEFLGVELAAASSVVSTTNELLQGIMEASTIAPAKAEPQTPDNVEAISDSIRNVINNTQAASTAEDLVHAQDTNNNFEASTTGQPPQGPPVTTEPPAGLTGNNYSSDPGMDAEDKEDLGKFNFKELIPAIDAIRAAQQKEFEAMQEGKQSFDFNNVIRALDSITSKGEDATSQTTTDLAGELIKQATAAEDAIVKLREFNENKAQNMRLVQLAEEQRLKEQHALTERRNSEEKAKAFALKQDLQQNRSLYLAEAESKLRTAHITKQNELAMAAINNEAKAKDLIANKEQYILEARLAHENAFYAAKNELEEESIAAQEAINWNSAHSKEIMEQELQKKRLGYLKEYQAYQTKAGKYAVDQAEFERDKARKDRDAAKKQAADGMISGLKKFGSGEFSMTDVKKSYSEYMATRTAELEDSGMSEASAELTANFELLAAAAGNLMDELDASVRKIADMQGFIDTRLQGSRENEKTQLSYGKQLLREAKWIAGVSPYIKQEKLVDNIRTLVDKGISFDVKQRAFLMTVQEKIANTFNVADGTLLRLIRIQQQDTTAGRLGMESALNSFLNSMYETSEYLESVAGSVRASLEEMQSLMEGTAAVELEYQVQKWMGSLFSVGMSDAAVQDIARAFGQIASGDISGLNGSGTGNLLIMAANEAGMSIADILQEGLQADETNKLMQAMVNYLAEIAEMSSDSRVVQQQLANVYGLKASDLRAATNLASSLKDVTKADMSYGGMMGQLNLMMNTIGLRTSVSEAMTNMWDNVMYSLASTQASDPMLYLLPKMANLLKDTTGGIDLPFVNVMGFGVDLNTTVADLMNVASLAGTALGTIGPALAGLTDLVNPLAGSVMLARAGINPFGKVPVLARGSAPLLQTMSGASVSESGYIGQSDGGAIKSQTLQGAEDDKKKQLVEAKDEETADDVVMKSQQAVIDIYNLLEELAHGSQSLRVRLVNNNGSVVGGGINSGVLNDYSSSSSTGSGVNTGADNGNWVFNF